jgi:transposase-like protein
MVRCPRCGAENTVPTKEWEYGPFEVKGYLCEKCKKKFNLYFYEGKLSHIIPKPKRK